MKKIVLLVLCLAFVSGMWAQKRVGQFSFIPRVGMNFSNLGDMDIHFANPEQDIMKSKVRTDVIAGAEVEYAVHKAVGVSLGAFYSRQGCHFKGYSMAEKIVDTQLTILQGIENHNVILQYINIPVQAKYRINEFLSLKTGLQCGVFLSGHRTFDWNYTEVKNGEVQKSQTASQDEDYKDLCSKTVWSIPVGFEVEYEHVNISVSYAIPLNGFAKETVLSIGGNNNSYRMSKGCNKVLSLTVGYRL